MHKYQVVIHWSYEDEVFVADVPELSGCIAEGPTRDAALAAVDKEVEGWLESARSDGHPIPEPQGYVKLRHGRGARRHERIEKRRRNRQRARQERQNPDSE